MAKSLYSKTLVAIALSSIFNSHVLAQSKSEETKDTQQIERVAVWSTSVKTSALYLQGEDIANKQADHISDLLRSIPGVDVGGAHSLNQRITVRSLGDKDLNISIDGARQNTYMYHHMGNLQIHADILKSVDIEIGSNSVINGGLAGSVRFETKQARELLAPEQALGARLQVNGGNNSGSGYSFTGYGLLTDEVDILAYYNDVNRDNYEVGGGEIKDGNGNIIDGTDGTVRGLAGDLHDALVKFGWNMTDQQRIALSYERYQDKGDYSYRPDMGLATDLAITNSLEVPLLWPTEFSRDTLTLSYDLLWGQSSQLKASVYNNTSELWRDEMGWQSNPKFAAWAGVVTGQTTNSGLNVLAETTFDHSEIAQEWVYGIDYIKHDSDFKARYSASIETSSEQATTVALFAQNRITINDAFALIPGLRYERYDIDSKVVDNRFDDFTYSIAAEYQATKYLLFKLSTTSLFKGPEIGEVFTGAGLFDSVNQQIDAETGLNSEFAVAYQAQLAQQSLLTVGGTLFSTDINNYIYDYANVPGGGARDYWKANIGDMAIEGFEAYIGYFIAGFKTQLTYASAESELSAFDDYASLDGARLDRQQGDTLSASLDYQFSEIDLLLHWELMTVDDLDAALDLDGASLDNAKDGFTIHTVSARWQPASLSEVTVIFGIDNLFDEYYASHSSRTGTSFHPRFGDLYLLDYEPGRNIKATLSYQF